jgi:hypothetical protein
MLAGILPEERLALFILAETTLQQQGVTDHTLDIEQIDVSGTDINQVYEILIATYQEYLIDITDKLGIGFSEEYPPSLEEHIAIVNGLSVLEDGENLDVIAMELDPDEDGEVSLARVLSEVTELTEHRLLECIESVEASTINALMALYTPELIADPMAAVAAQRYRQYMGERRNGLMFEFIKERGQLPLQVTDALRAMGPIIGELPPSEQPHEWVSLFLASNLEDEELGPELLSDIRGYIQDTDFLTVAPRLTALLPERVPHDEV